MVVEKSRHLLSAKSTRKGKNIMSDLIKKYEKKLVKVEMELIGLYSLSEWQELAIEQATLEKVIYQEIIQDLKATGRL